MHTTYVILLSRDQVGIQKAKNATQWLKLGNPATGSTMTCYSYTYQAITEYIKQAVQVAIGHQDNTFWITSELWFPFVESKNIGCALWQ